MTGRHFDIPAIRELMKPVDRLSLREREVLKRFGTGIGCSDIGREMNLSMKTVSTYLTRAQDKFKLTTRAQLRVLAVQMVSKGEI